jgi:hypothetical protein
MTFDLHILYTSFVCGKSCCYMQYLLDLTDSHLVDLEFSGPNFEF